MRSTHFLALLLILFLTPETKAQGLFRTACSGNIERLDSLLTHTPIDTLDNRGRLLLHWAVACKQPEVLDYLLERQNNSTWSQKHGGTLLELAVSYDNSGAIAKLVRAGVDIDQKNSRGSTALEVAERLGKREITEALLQQGADPNLVRHYKLAGAYLGQEPPDSKALVFAPNFISTEEQEFGSVFNKPGDEFYFGVDVGQRNEIRVSMLVNGQWSKPEVIISHEKYGYNDPFLSNDENRLYFISNQALDGIGEPKDIDIWYSEKTASGWSDPINAGSNINTAEDEYYISFTTSGTMYFSSNGHSRSNSSEKASNRGDHDIYFSEIANGEFQPPVQLPPAINTADYEADVFIAPDESYIIFCSTRKEGFGGGDLYISFKDSAGQWGQAVNMGEAINSEAYEFCPYVTPDGKYLFYTSNMDIYWVSTEILNSYRD